MNFRYSLEHVNFSKLTSLKELLKALKEHDYDSFRFSYGVGKINAAISKEMGMNEEDIFLSFQCGVYHDAGKLGMSYEFLNFEGRYTVDMFNEMKKHAAGGAFVLEKVNASKHIIDTAKHHHSNFDGTGYPSGFFGKEIPLFARMTRVADSVDAYMSKRCYKDGGPTKEALKDLQQYIGTSYDPEIVEYFSIVHTKVMKECHKNGFDHPSQDVYMHFLETIYKNNYEKIEFGDLLEN